MGLNVKVRSYDVCVGEVTWYSLCFCVLIQWLKRLTLNSKDPGRSFSVSENWFIRRGKKVHLADK